MNQRMKIAFRHLIPLLGSQGQGELHLLTSQILFQTLRHHEIFQDLVGTHLSTIGLLRVSVEYL